MLLSGLTGDHSEERKNKRFYNVIDDSSTIRHQKINSNNFVDSSDQEDMFNYYVDNNEQSIHANRYTNDINPKKKEQSTKREDSTDYYQYAPINRYSNEIISPERGAPIRTYNQQQTNLLMNSKVQNQPNNSHIQNRIRKTSPLFRRNELNNNNVPQFIQHGESALQSNNSLGPIIQNTRMTYPNLGMTINSDNIEQISMLDSNNQNMKQLLFSNNERRTHTNFLQSLINKESKKKKNQNQLLNKIKGESGWNERFHVEKIPEYNVLKDKHAKVYTTSSTFLKRFNTLLHSQDRDSYRSKNEIFFEPPQSSSSKNKKHSVKDLVSNVTMPNIRKKVRKEIINSAQKQHIQKENLSKPKKKRAASAGVLYRRSTTSNPYSNLYNTNQQNRTSKEHTEKTKRRKLQSAGALKQRGSSNRIDIQKNISTNNGVDTQVHNFLQKQKKKKKSEEQLFLSKINESVIIPENKKEQPERNSNEDYYFSDESINNSFNNDIYYNNTSPKQNFHGKNFLVFSSHDMDKAAELLTLFDKSKEKIETLWEEMHINERERMYYRSKFGFKIRFPTENNIRLLKDEIQRLTHHKQYTLNVLQSINQREKYLSAMMLLVRLEIFKMEQSLKEDQNSFLGENNNTSKVRLKQIKNKKAQTKGNKLLERELQKLVVSLRIASLDVVESILLWRDGLNIPKPFIWKNQNYLLKMRNDIDFVLNSPIVGYINNFSKGSIRLQNNPFLLELETKKSLKLFSSHKLTIDTDKGIKLPPLQSVGTESNPHNLNGITKKTNVPTPVKKDPFKERMIAAEKIVFSEARLMKGFVSERETRDFIPTLRADLREKENSIHSPSKSRRKFEDPIFKHANNLEPSQYQDQPEITPRLSTALRIVKEKRESERMNRKVRHVQAFLRMKKYKLIYEQYLYDTLEFNTEHLQSLYRTSFSISKYVEIKNQEAIFEASLSLQAFVNRNFVLQKSKKIIFQRRIYTIYIQSLIFGCDVYVQTENEFVVDKLVSLLLSKNVRNVKQRRIQAREILTESLIAKHSLEQKHLFISTMNTIRNLMFNLQCISRSNEQQKNLAKKLHCAIQIQKGIRCYRSRRIAHKIKQAQTKELLNLLDEERELMGQMKKEEERRIIELQTLYQGKMLFLQESEMIRVFTENEKKRQAIEEEIQRVLEENKQQKEEDEEYNEQNEVLKAKRMNSKYPFIYYNEESRRIKPTEEEKNHSATIIQNTYRARKAKIDMKKRKQEIDDQLGLEVKNEKAAHLIQNHIRGMIVRRRDKRTKGCVEELESLLSKKLERKNYVNINQTITSLQNILSTLSIESVNAKLQYQTVLFQSLLQMNQIEESYTRQKSIKHESALLIQTWFKSYMKNKNHIFSLKNKKENEIMDEINIENKIVLIQRAIKTKNSILRVKEQRNNTLKYIQSIYRSNKQNRKYDVEMLLLRINSSTTIKKSFLRFKAVTIYKERKQKYEEEIQKEVKEEEAALAIQKKYRFYSTKKRLSNVLLHIIEAQSLVRKNTASVIYKKIFERGTTVELQSLKRSFDAERNQHLVSYTMRMCQAFVRRINDFFVSPNKIDHIKSSVLKLQKCYRVYKAKSKISQINHDMNCEIESFYRMEQASLKIQCAYRGYRMRTNKTKTNAAHTIQRSFKAYASVRDSRERRSLQEEKMLYADMKMKNILIIQKSFRMLLSRKEIQNNQEKNVQILLYSMVKAKDHYMFFKKISISSSILLNSFNKFISIKKASEVKKNMNCLIEEEIEREISSFKIQKQVRMYLAKRRVKLMKNQIVTDTSHFISSNKHLKSFTQKKMNSICVQSRIRMLSVTNKMLHVSIKTLIIQKAFRSYKSRMLHRNLDAQNEKQLNEVLQKERSALLIQRNYRKYKSKQSLSNNKQRYEEKLLQEEQLERQIFQKEINEFKYNTEEIREASSALTSFIFRRKFLWTFSRLVYSALVVQENIRGNLQKNKIILRFRRERDESASLIQRWFEHYINNKRKLVLLRKKKEETIQEEIQNENQIILIQKAVRVKYSTLMIEENKIRILGNIQHICRRNIQIEEYERENLALRINSASTIKKCFLRFKAMEIFKERKQKYEEEMQQDIRKEKAAFTIQKWYRILITRRKISQMNVNVSNKIESLRRTEQASLKIQCAYRGYRMRTNKTKTNAAHTIQRSFKAYASVRDSRERRSLQEEKMLYADMKMKNILIIQKSFRMLLSRKEIQNNQEKNVQILLYSILQAKNYFSSIKLLIKSSNTLSKAFIRFKSLRNSREAKKNVYHIVEREIEREISSFKIQKQVRMYLAKRRVKLMKNQIVTDTSHFISSNKHLKSFTQKKMNSICVQSRIRMLSVTNKMLHVSIKTLIIQKAFRSYKSRMLHRNLDAQNEKQLNEVLQKERSALLIQRNYRKYKSKQSLSNNKQRYEEKLLQEEQLERQIFQKEINEFDKDIQKRTKEEEKETEKKLNLKKEEACETIQKNYRRYRVTKDIETRKLSFENMVLKEDAKERAAMTIQNNYRTFAGKRDFQKAVQIKEIESMKQFKKELIELTAAITIQRLIRKYLAKKEYQKRKEQVQENLQIEMLEERELLKKEGDLIIEPISPRV